MHGGSTEFRGRILPVRWPGLILVLAAVAAAGCGGDDEETPTVTQTATVTETASVPELEGTTAPEEEERETDPDTPGQGQGDCGAVGGNTIEVVAGEVDCAEARATASGYDTQGARVQQVGSWTCEGGTAATRPVVFTCSQDGREFVAREPG